MVDLVATDEQQQIAESIEDYLVRELPISRLTSRAAGASDSHRLRHMADLGWLGMGLPEAMGGVGYGAVEESILFRLLGRHLVTPTVLANVLSAAVAAKAGGGALAQGLLSGAARAALAIPVGSALVGDKVSGSFLLLDPKDAEVTLVFDGAGALLLETEKLTSRRPTSSMDESVALERTDLVDMAALVRVEGPQTQMQAKLLAAAMLVGICEGTRDMASEYAKVRTQFDQPIGTFQAIKHKCADMALRADAAGHLVSFASICVQDGRPDAEYQTSAAKLLSAQYALLSGKENIQVHGAMGFTTELPAHFYLKRAHVLDQFAGSVRRQQQALLSEPAPQASRA